jgi:Anti-sigma-K factor rskA/Putative zinc-finger
MSFENNTPHDPASDAAAYLLGAMEPAEAARYLRHLAGCSDCRDELTAFRPVADALPLAAPQYPPPDAVRRRVLRAVHAEPRFGRYGRRRRTWADLTTRTPGRALAGAVAVALTVAVIVVASLSGGSIDSRVLQARVVDSSGVAQLRIDGGHGELIVRHLPPPPAGRIYEVWLKRPNTKPAPTSALFSVTANGAADVGVPGNLQGVSEILVTQEPAGGSLVSTHQPMIIAPTS